MTWWGAREEARSYVSEYLTLQSSVTAKILPQILSILPWHCLYFYHFHMDMVRYDPLYAHRVLQYRLWRCCIRFIVSQFYFQPLHAVLVHDAPLVQLELDAEPPSFQLLLSCWTRTLERMVTTSVFSTSSSGLQTVQTTSRLYSCFGFFWA